MSDSRLPKSKRLSISDAIVRQVADSILAVPGATSHDHKLITEMVVNRLTEYHGRLDRLASSTQQTPEER